MMGCEKHAGPDDFCAVDDGDAQYLSEKFNQLAALLRILAGLKGACAVSDLIEEASEAMAQASEEIL